MENIKTVLGRYKQRFIATTSRSRTYFLTRLVNKHTLDIVEFDEAFGENENLEHSLNTYNPLRFERQTVDVETVMTMLMEGDYENAKEILPTLTIKDIKEIENTKKAAAEDEEENNNKSSKSTSTIDDPSDDSTDATVLSQINDTIQTAIKKLNKKFSNVDKLLKESKKQFRDFGKDDLYLGYPFIEGRFISGKYFRAPLILHKVDIKANASKITISLVQGESIINPVFLIAYHIENEMEHKKIDWNLDNDEFMSSVRNKLDDLSVHYKIKEPLARFNSCTKKEYREKALFDYNEFHIKKNIVLGLFPLSDKNIFDDLQKLETSNYEEEDSLVEFIHGNDSLNHLFEEEEKTRAKEDEIKYITDLDYSQKNVVKEALSKSLVIEGPPGTGKSQVLSNIVANYVNQDKKVLVVSQKVPAIEVIYNRIGKLSKNALLIKNHVTDKSSFFEQLKTAIETIKNSEDSDGFEPFSDLDGEIEYIFNELESRDAIYQKDYHGFSFEEIVKSYYEPVNKLEHSIKVLNHHLEHFNTRKEVYETLKSSIQRVYDVYIPEINVVQSQLFNDGDVTTELVKKVIEYLVRSETYEGNKDILFTLIVNDVFDSVSVEPETYRDASTAVLEKLSYRELREKIVNLFESKTTDYYKEHLKETKHSLYEYIGTSDKVRDQLQKWKQLKPKQKVLFVKQLNDPDYKIPFFTFFPLKKLDQDEMKIYETIEEDYETLNPSQLAPEAVQENDQLLRLVIEHEDRQWDAITYKAFESGIYSVDHKNLSNLFEKLKGSRHQFNKETLAELLNEENFIIEISMALALDKLKDSKEALNHILWRLTQKDYESIQSKLAFFNQYDVHLQKLRNSQQKKIRKSRLTIEHSMNDRIKRIASTNPQFKKDVGELLRLSNHKRKKSIRYVTERYHDTITNLFPITLMTPGTVSAVFPNHKHMFDVVIFDEASQMFVEHAVPSIHRCETIIVAGDSQQLRPSSIFSQRFAEGEELEDVELDTDVYAALEEESLLDYCKTKYESVDLRYHYRSEHKELIDFSSRAFYDSRLVFSSNVESNIKVPIELVEVEGEWVDNINEVEAIKVLEIIEHILNTRENNETIGVITFNSKQMELISDMIEERQYENEALQKELDRENKETKADESLFVKNIENVQGDERDIMIFSVAYARNQKGRFINSFGSLSQPGGENRLNVAITRAKKKIYLVKSIKANIMNVNEETKGNYYFKKYLQYVERLNSGQDIEPFLNELGDVDLSSHELSNFDSPFETEVFEALKKRIVSPYELRNQVRVGSFSIDLAIYDTAESKYVLGIECDGAMYHSTKEAVDHDYYRQEYLESRGWNIHRIWSTNWWQNASQEIQKVLAQIN